MKSAYALLFGATLLTACSGDPYRGVYEGIKAQKEARKTPQERAMTPEPSYDTYKREKSGAIQ